MPLLPLIDISSGALVVPGRPAIGKDVLLESVSVLFTAEKTTTWNVGNGWLHYYVRNIIIGERYFILDFTFFEGLLKRIDLGFFEEPVVQQSWDNWSEDKQIGKRNEYDRWLDTTIVKERTFKWGGIQAYYDPKGGGSGIGITFN